MNEPLTKDEQVPPQIQDYSSATFDELIARYRYCQRMASKIRDRQARNEWYDDATACDTELERRGVNTWGIDLWTKSHE